MTAAGAALSASQDVQILGVLEDKRTALETIHKAGSSGEVAMKELASLDAAADKAILADLSEAQRKVYLSLHRPGRVGPQAASVPPGQRADSSNTTSQEGPVDSGLDANTGGGIRQDQ